jgi:hypothetical protein
MYFRDVITAAFESLFKQRPVKADPIAQPATFEADGAHNHASSREDVLDPIERA